ncbi:unnamed protein product [Calypogeia fissa]
MDLPYFADPNALPSRLPTKEEIESSKDVIIDHRTRRVVGIGPHFVVKYGRRIDPTEGQNMLFVQQNTSVPVPRVYAIYTDSSDGTTYIIMERITGDSLKSVWLNFSDVEKTVVSAKLRGSMDQLRRLPSPGSYCRLGNRGLIDEFFGDRGSSIVGPFDTEAEFNAAMLEYVSNTSRPANARLYERLFCRVFHDHPPTFTHGDFQQKNILVRKPKSLDGRPGEDLEVVLIDWEFSAWFPSYWESTMALYLCGRSDDDWYRWLPLILDEYLVELPLMKMLCSEVCIGC